ncbi:MAG: hypothetical protein GC162_13485 [Planctomycetes bacterium]|nr:hypothetical protein [Planctomycetota bacterium]
MTRPTDITIDAARLYFLPVTTRVPLKFGSESLTSVTCARAAVRVSDASGRSAEGWGETPLSVQWVWPSSKPYEPRHEALKQFCIALTEAWASFDHRGHALEIGHAFERHVLHDLLARFNASRAADDQLPHLAALLCMSVVDIATHDAYGRLHDKPVYETYRREFLSHDLSHFLTPAEGAAVSFAGVCPDRFLLQNPAKTLRAWHLVGGLDALTAGDLKGDEPDDGYPVTLEKWIERDGLTCLKIKLRGNDGAWDEERLRRVGAIARARGVDWLSVDFNCTVTDPDYVNAILDRLRDTDPKLYGMILYVEQPFPYELRAHPIDVHSVSARKPLFLDESAHDWEHVRLGRALGWTGVALKTCKTQTGALLSLCWAKAHGMPLMVQDLTNPMLAMIPHVQLAAHAGTIMGVETNACQFYPAASDIEAHVHPGLYQRRGGCVDLSTIRGAGFGYRIEEMRRDLGTGVA